MNIFNKYKYIFYGIFGGVIWAFYTLCINRYYRTNIFNTYWYTDNLKELFSESIINNVICVLSAFIIGLGLWVKVKKQKIRDFVVRGKLNWVVVIINGLLSGTAATILYHLSVQFSGEVYASAVTTMYIPLASIYSWLVFKNANLKSILGVLLVTMALIWIGFLDSGTENVRNLLVGVLASGAVGICWALEAILNFYFLNKKGEVEVDSSVFIAYRQLVSLIGIVCVAFALYPILAHSSAIGSDLKENSFKLDWIITMVRDKSVVWLIVGSLFNSFSDFSYYLSCEGLGVPSSTTLNNLDTPTGLFLTIFLVVFNMTGIFGEQSIPSLVGIILVFCILFGSSLIVFFDSNKILEEDSDIILSKKAKYRNFYWSNAFLVSLFVICAFVAHGPNIGLDNVKQKDVSFDVNERTIKEYASDSTLDKYDDIIKNYKNDNE